MKELYKPAIYWGIKMGILSILMFLIIYAIDPMFLGTTKGWIVNLSVSMLAVPIVFMILGARDTKKNLNHLTFGQAFNAAFFTAIVSAVIVLLFNLIFMTVIDPTWEEELYDEVVRSTATLMEDMGAPEESVDETVKQMKIQNEARIKGPLGALKNTGVGLLWYAFLALIVGAVQKSKKIENESID